MHIIFFHWKSIKFFYYILVIIRSYNNSSPEAIAENVMKVASTGIGELDVAAMKKYIQYCKAKCSPRLSEEAGEVLASSYVKIRDDIRKRSLSSISNNTKNKKDDNTQTVIPITVRQLEALVRISESLAKMRIDSIVRAEDVTEALRLFKVSTMAASSIDQDNDYNNKSNNNNNTYNGTSSILNRDETERTESFLRCRLTIGSLLNKQKLIEEGVNQSFNALIISKCLFIMAGRGELIERNQGRLIKRIK